MNTRTRSTRSGVTLAVVQPPTVTVAPAEVERLVKRMVRAKLVWRDPDGTIHREKVGESPRAFAAMLGVTQQGLFARRNRRRFSQKKVARLQLLEPTRERRKSRGSPRPPAGSA